VPVRTNDGAHVEDEVMATVSAVLGRPVGRDDDFFLAGGDSLAAADLVLALERIVGRRLPPSLVMGSPTVARLTAALGAVTGAEAARLVTHASGGDGPPLVLVPSHYGHGLLYAALAKRLEGSRPILMLDSSIRAGGQADAADFESVARRYVAVLRDAALDGPYELAGYCFGGAMAYEVAHQMAGSGDGPARLYLLGVSPYDFPGLARPGAEAAWKRSMTSRGRIGLGLRFVAGLTTSDARGYLAGRLRNRIRLAAERASPAGRARQRSRRARDAQVLAVHGRYSGPPLRLPVTLILPAWSLATYCSDPAAMWRALGSEVRVHLVPGVERMMVRDPIASRVAALMTGDGDDRA
jgi:thioesterase domain-containing protein/acyl carrier protein